jgi:hypothetical protein
VKLARGEHEPWIPVASRPLARWTAAARLRTAPPIATTRSPQAARQLAGGQLTPHDRACALQLLAGHRAALLHDVNDRIRVLRIHDFTHEDRIRATPAEQLEIVEAVLERGPDGAAAFSGRTSSAAPWRCGSASARRSRGCSRAARERFRERSVAVTTA